MKHPFFAAILNILVLCTVILATSAYFIHHTRFIGLIIVGLGVLCLISLIPFHIPLNRIWPDIIFGIIDNGILAIMAIFGGEMGGVAGAVIGGVVGNAVTDGIAGIFEGLIAERSRAAKISDKRTMLGSAVGKMSGCLLSAGAVLCIASLLT
jgi:hypothetical protein